MAAAAALVLAAPAHAAPQPYFDVRQAAPEAEPGVATRALERRLGDQAVVELDKVTGTPRMLARLDGTLSGPAEGAPEAVALRYVRSNLAALGLSASDLDTLDTPTVSTSGALTEVRWPQSAGGIPSADSELRVVLTSEGEVLSVLGAPSGDLGTDTTPTLSAVDALEAVHDDTGTSGTLTRRTTHAGATRATRFTDGTGAKLRRFAGRLAWNVRYRAAPDAVYDVMVDAGTGKILRRINLVSSAALADVWEYYPSAPNGGQAVEVDLQARGWLGAGATSLNGPYVHAYSDLNDNDSQNGGEAINRRANDTFKYPFTPPATGGGNGCTVLKPCSWDHTVPNSWMTNREQNGVQAFYLANRFHDHLAQAPISFTAAEGAFEGTDKLILNTMDGASTGPDSFHANNANMYTPPRGEPPLMQMYLWRLPFRTMNSGDDASILYHEYVHGLTSRLVTDAGGAGALNSFQAGAMGEGWSDFYAKDFLVAEGYEADTAAAGEVHMGVYTDVTPNAIRAQALDCPAGAAAGVCLARGTAGAGGFTYGDFGKIANGPQLHADGEIWAQTLWDLRGALGVSEARRLITQALRISPPEPSFLDMRNAILLADQASGAAHRTAIWSVFANRGMGFYAMSVDASDIAPIEDTSAPPAPGGPTGTIAGQVTDAVTGDPIAGVKAAVGGLSGSPDALEDTSDAGGLYSVGGVPAQTFPSFVFSVPGYDRLIRPVTVPAGGSATLDAELRRNWATTNSGATVAGTDDFPGYGCAPAAAVDQSAATVWSSNRNLGPRSIVVTFREPVTISSFEINPTEGCSDPASAAVASVTILASKAASGESFVSVATPTFNPSHRHKMNVVLPTTAAVAAGHLNGVRRVRVTMSDPQGASSFMDMTEFAAYGYPAGFEPTPTPSPSPSPSPSPTATPSPTPTATATPAATPTPLPTVAPTPTAIPTPTPTPIPKPRFVLGASGKRAVNVKVTCYAACSVKAGLTVDAKTAKRLGLGRSRTAATLTRSLRPGAATTLKLSLSSKARKGLARAKLKSFKGTLKVQAGDAKAQRRVTIRR